MKNFIKFMTLAVVIGLMFLPSTEILAVGVTAGTTITNQAKVDGANFSTASNSITTNVRVIAGAGWSAGLDILGAVAGSTRSNVSYFTNLGNSAIDYQFSVDTFGTFGTTGGPWTWTLYVNGGAAYASSTGNMGVYGANENIASGANIEIILVVDIDVTAGSGWEEWRLIAQATTPHVNTTQYAGDQAVPLQYGGDATSGWGTDDADRQTFNDTGIADGSLDTVFRLATDAPLIGISKTISAISDPSGGGVAIAIPGATITYSIEITNSGSGVANNVRVIDTFDNVNTTIVAASETDTDNTGGPRTWTFSSGGNQVQWSNSAGAFNGGNKSTFTFQVTIN